MKVVFSHDAVADLRRLREFLEPHNPSSADAALQAIMTAAESLRMFPERGRLVENPQVRRVIRPFGRASYIIDYSIDERISMVVIQRIRHGREER